MFMRSVGVLSRLAMTWGARTQSFIFIIFSAERAYTTVIFGCAFCRLMPWMERVTTMNQLTEINKSAESLKTNKNKNTSSLIM